MSTLITIGACILGYSILGLCWARTQAVRLQTVLNKARKSGSKYKPWWAETNSWERDLVAGMSLHAACWPVSLFARVWLMMLHWSIAPVRSQQEKVAGPRARADKMAEMVDGLPTEEDRRILRACIRENRELAKQLEL